MINKNLLIDRLRELEHEYYIVENSTLKHKSSALKEISTHYDIIEKMLDASDNK